MRRNRIIPTIAAVLLVGLGVFFVYVGLSGHAGGGGGVRGASVVGAVAIVVGCFGFWRSRRR
jgi:hypothetical protein